MKKWLIIGGALILLCVVINFFPGILGLSKSPFAQLSLPKPVIVSSLCNNKATTPLDEGTRVSAEIRNDGVAGDVVFEATVFQGGNHWTKTKMVTMGPSETKHFIIDFMETTLGGGKKTYTVKSYPLR